MLSRPLAVLFDLDGTLIDSTELILQSARHAYAGVSDHSYSDGEWLEGMGTPLRVQLARFAAAEHHVPALADRYREFQIEHHDRLVTPFAAAAEVLERLRAGGHPLAIVTSKMTYMARHGLAHCGLDVPLMIAADDCRRHKPDPEPVQLALDRLGYAPSEAIFVGDSPHDVGAGRAAGVVTVGAVWGPCGRDALVAAGADHLLADLGDLPALVARLDAAPR
ncbi:MAG TPA: HAD-IA family hydrolase [Gemmatimonadaceae bacterium]|nr:HAD-IA family hydrolase [Gemmatimonadaceae bacterium]